MAVIQSTRMHARPWLWRWSQMVALGACAISLSAVTVGRKQLDRWRMYPYVAVEGGRAYLGGEVERELLGEVGSKMGISNDDLSRVVIFFTTLDSPIFRGCLNSPIHKWLKTSWLPNGGIGLPLYYKNKYLDETNYEKLVINGKSFDITPDSPEGIQFRRQMILTEDAKKFILARQLYYLKCNVYFIRDCASIGAAYLVFQIAFIMNRFIKVMPKMPTPSRLVIYSLVAGMVYILKRELMEAYILRLHYKADDVARLDSRYFNGAMEFYQKSIRRNKILHDMGFTKQFTKLGNEISGVLFNYDVVNSHVRLSRLINHNNNE